MGLEEERAKRREAFLSEEFTAMLPKEIGLYRLHRTDSQNDRIYEAYAYEDAETGWRIRILFDEETMDYMVKTDFRLFVLTDIDLITGDFEEFKKRFPLFFERNVRKCLIERPVSVVVRGRAFTTWNFETALPPVIGAYRRMIAPDAPIQGLNGSYIIAMYENREKECGILFFYNYLREFYYAEGFAHGVPIILHDYDAKDAEILEEIIRSRMESDLRTMSEKEGV